MNDSKIRKEECSASGDCICKEMKTMCGLCSFAQFYDYNHSNGKILWTKCSRMLQQCSKFFEDVLPGKRKSRVGKLYRVKDKSIIGVRTTILLQHQKPADESHPTDCVITALRWSCSQTSSKHYNMLQLCTYVIISFTSCILTTTKSSVMSFP